MSKQWFAVRSLIYFCQSEDDRQVYEERVCLFRAKDDREAFKLAEAELERYCAQDDELDWHPNLELRSLEHGDDLDGQEVWSFLTVSDSDFDQYFQERFDAQEYFPEDDDEDDD